jgi:hypothetical protein
MSFPVINAEGFLVDQSRIMTHPTLGSVEYVDDNGESINPDITRRFILAPAKRIDTTVTKTIGSSVIVQQPEFDEDVVITEIWTATGSKLSILAALFRSLHNFWVTLPPIGEFLTWEPRDISVESYGVNIIDVTLPTSDLQYREIPSTRGQQAGAYLAEQFTLKFKIVAEEIAPKGSVSLVGL